MPQPIRLSPVLLDGSLAYLAAGDADELAFFVDALPGVLDNDLHKRVRGTATSCHVWRGFTWVSDEELRDHVDAAAQASRCDVTIAREPLVAPIPCGCGQHCACTEVCWFCGVGVPVQTHDGKACCEGCASAFKEALGAADTEPPPPAPVVELAPVARETSLCARCGEEPALSDTEALGARCFDDELRLRNLSASLDLVQDAKALGISPRSVLQGVRKGARGIVGAVLLALGLATSTPAHATITPAACAWDCGSCVRACRSSDCRAECTVVASACCEAAGRKPPSAPGFCGCH